MMYNKIECPNCGNEISVSSQQEPQKCKWCRRLLKVKVIKIHGRKFIWEAEPVDFNEPFVYRPTDDKRQRVMPNNRP